MDTDDLEWIVRGSRYDVAFLRPVAQAFASANPKGRRRVENSARIFGEEGPRGLHTEVYKHEGRFKTGEASGRQVAIAAFKGWQLRVYGSVQTIDEKPTFIGTEIDTSKKQNRANKAKLQRAALKFAPAKKAKKGGRSDVQEI